MAKKTNKSQVQRKDLINTLRKYNIDTNDPRSILEIIQDKNRKEIANNNDLKIKIMITALNKFSEKNSKESAIASYVYVITKKMIETLENKEVFGDGITQE